MTKIRNLIVWPVALAAVFLLVLFVSQVVLPAISATVPITANVGGTETVTTEPATTIPQCSTPELAYGISYKQVYTKDAVLENIHKAETALGNITCAIDSGDYTADACVLMVDELNRLREILIQYNHDLERYLLWEEEYSVATYVWAALKADGYSDEVCAGILGNMMAECGGHTLALDYTAYNSREHGGGLCGWLYRYYPEANGASLEEQVNILLSTIEEQIDYSYSFEQFTKTTDVSTAALTFAKHYERCNSMSYTVRQRSAQKAYAYFVLGEQH